MFRSQVTDPRQQDTPVTLKDTIGFSFHRHEPPVLHVPIPILATTDTAVVVCKPASMPVHPTARGGSIVVASVR